MDDDQLLLNGLAWGIPNFRYTKKFESGERIEIVLTILKTVWQRYPDLSLLELIISTSGGTDSCADLHLLKDIDLVRNLTDFVQRER